VYLVGGRRIAALVALLRAAGTELDRARVGIVEHGRRDDQLIGVWLSGCGLVVGGLRGQRLALARFATASPPAPARPQAPAGRTLLGGLGRCVLPTAALELFDELLTAHEPIAVDAGRGSALVEVGQVHLTQF
jgi:hypothetical protein